LAQTIVKPVELEARQISKIKIKICESEASETQYWIEVIVDAKWLSWENVKAEYDECSELLAIFSSIGKK